MDEQREPGQCDNPSKRLTPDSSSGVAILGSSFGAKFPTGFRSAPRKGVDGPASSMPNRILREGILSSERVNRLSVHAELFYRRLLSVADDYGRYFAHPALLRSACYPLRVDHVKEHHISQWLKETIEAGLVETYRVNGTPYLEVIDFRQQIRAKSSKYPSLEKMPSKCVADTQHDDSRLQTKIDPPSFPPSTTTTTSPTTKEGGVGETNGFDAFWLIYPKKVGKQDARKAWQKLAPASALRATILQAVTNQMTWRMWLKDGGEFIPHPATWLHGQRWEDDLEGCGEDPKVAKLKQLMQQENR